MVRVVIASRSNAVKLGREVALHTRHHRNSQSQESILKSLNLAALLLGAGPR
jgi:hypothetical protein